MMFIQALEKAQSRPLDHLKAQKKVVLSTGRTQTDLVDLSDAASHIFNLNINSSNSAEFDAEMNIEAILLQQALLYLSNLPIPIYPLNSLKMNKSEWDIALQKPPRTTPSYSNKQTNAYSGNMRHSPTEILNYQFSINILSSSYQQHEFTMEMRVARFTQQQNKWPLPEVNRVKLAPVQSDQDNGFLSALENHSIFFFDQDGNSNQAAPIIEAMRTQPTEVLLKDNPFFEGMRVWRCHGEKLDIALIGDPFIGAIHTATINA